MDLQDEKRNFYTDVNSRFTVSTIYLLTCKLLHSAAKHADVFPQVWHSGEGVFLQLIHVIGTTAAASLAVEGAVTVPLVADQRFLTDCSVWEQKEKKKQDGFTALRHLKLTLLSLWRGNIQYMQVFTRNLV